MQANLSASSGTRDRTAAKCVVAVDVLNSQPVPFANGLQFESVLTESPADTPAKISAFPTHAKISEGQDQPLQPRVDLEKLATGIGPPSSSTWQFLNDLDGHAEQLGQRSEKTPADHDQKLQSLVDELPRSLSPGELDSYLRTFCLVLAAGEPSELIVTQWLKKLCSRVAYLDFPKVSAKEMLHVFNETNGPPNKAGGTHGAYFMVPAALDVPLEPGQQPGLYRSCGPGQPPLQLTNVAVSITHNVEIRDEIEPHRQFDGVICDGIEQRSFSISPSDFASDHSLSTVLFNHAGPKLVLPGKLPEIRMAISTLSDPARVITTTSHGWDEAGGFLTGGGRITAAGFEPYTASSGVRFDASAEEIACRLALRPLATSELIEIKQHIVDDLLALHPDPLVGHALLSAVGLALLQQSVSDYQRFTLWINGLTGVGKSFTTKLFQNFFGNFPIGLDCFASWSSTMNSLQRQGYYFRNALYLIDDYKPELVNPAHAVRLLQNFADNAARGRLKADSTAMKIRPIRGFLVATGEDVPNHTSSVLARMIVLRMDQAMHDVVRGDRCRNLCHLYSGVTADLVRYLAANNIPAGFAASVNHYRDHFFADIRGQQNDLRIAGNFGMLAAGFEVMAGFFVDVWPAALDEVENFVSSLAAPRDAMLSATLGSQSSEVFFHELANLVEHGHVRIERISPRGSHSEAYAQTPSIGTTWPSTMHGPIFRIATSLAVGEVNAALRRQARPEIKAAPSALLAQLRDSGHLVDQEGNTLAADAALTRQAYVGGRNRHCFHILASRLLGSFEVAGRPGAVRRGPRMVRS